MSKWYGLVIGLLLLLGIILGFYFYGHDSTGRVDMLSLSSDGRYVISTDEKETAILWDIHKKTHQVVGRKAHVFSAYFIPNTHDYLWQGQDKVIHVQTVQGNVLETFKVPFLIYGVVMTSDRKYFLAGDIRWGLNLCIKQHCRRILGNSHRNQNEMTALKPYNLSMTPGQRYAVGSRLGTVGSATPNPQAKDYLFNLGTQGVVLWDIRTGKPIREYVGNQSQTFATLSPDGKYVVAGDVQPNVFVWNRKTGKQLVELWPLLGKVIKHDNGITFDRSSTIPIPPGFLSESSPTARTANVLSLKFIDKTHYLRFTTQEYYAILYDVLSPKPSKYLSLGETPAPSTYYLERDQSIDTSPSAHILVVGKAFEPGIMVYRYAPKHQTLTKIWDAK